jgi:MIP family channel proteins
MPSLLRRATAEAVGTFALVFVGAGSLASKYYPETGFGLLNVAVAHGVVLAAMVSATMAISGGHLNPAVTAGLLVARRINVRTALTYIAAQLAAAVLAALLLKLVTPASIARADLLGTPTVGLNVTFARAVAFELVLTFFLVSTVFGTCVHPQAPKIGGLAIGMALLVGILAAGPISGGALNPARAFGPALVTGTWAGQAVYWIGPLLGGILAGLLWEYVLLPERE